jgi:hypothetical protein
MALINTTTTGVLGSTFVADGTGDLTIQQNGVTINKVTKQPLFSVWKSSGQTVSTGTFTKVTFDSVQANQENCFDTSTSRFTPNVPGFYQINGLIYHQSTSYVNRTLIHLRANGGGEFRFGSDQIISNSITTEGRSLVSTLVYLNGTTDYLEILGLFTGAGTLTCAGGFMNTWWTGHLVKAS